MKSSRRHFAGDNMTEDLEFPLMELTAVVMATENFSDCNELGKGGFGIVYKVKVGNTQKHALNLL